MRRPVVASFFVLVILAAALLTGCAASEPIIVGDPLGAAPPDFSLDVLILTQPPAGVGAEQPHPLEAQRVQSRYVLFADGSLHYGPDTEGRGARWIPPLTRILTRRQVAEIWSLSRQLGLANPEAGDEPFNFKLVHPEPDEIIYLAAYGGFGRGWSFIFRNRFDQPTDPAMMQLVRLLAQLAWANEQPELETRTIPKRYDFGPDPYERYRTPETALRGEPSR